jgi:redox-sensitive bicupin YhaK (pirin superfamily)
MAVACPDKRVRLEAKKDSHLMVIGGAALGERHIWWNFVSSSEERIEQAKTDWQENRFDAVSGETEFIPLPS